MPGEADDRVWLALPRTHSPFPAAHPRDGPWGRSTARSHSRCLHGGGRPVRAAAPTRGCASSALQSCRPSPGGDGCGGLALAGAGLSSSGGLSVPSDGWMQVPVCGLVNGPGGTVTLKSSWLCQR